MAAETLGLVLAGGLARRMGGGDKPLKLLGGRPLLDHVLARITPQVAAVALNANGDPARFAGYGLPVIADPLPDHPGPLAGILAGLEWAAAHRPDLAWVASRGAWGAGISRSSLWAGGPCWIMCWRGLRRRSPRLR